MLRILTTIFLSLVITLTVPYAGAQGNDAGGQTRAEPASGPRRYLSQIIFAGLAGAILGLSTLSFYGRPQDKLSNIAVGFAVGVIGGTMYTTFKAATEPHDFYGAYDLGTNEVWALQESSRWGDELQVPRATFVFEF
ncbi:MAG: hypothetical protein AB7G93_02555 [Bdellovibrionales bacterium]